MTEMDKEQTEEPTFKQLKKEREVPELARENLKNFNRVKRAILKALEEGPMTIPQVADKLGMKNSEVTYNLMTLRKYGLITAGEQDDMDEYFYYQLKKQ
jgi:predicted transcriptional regulator